MSKIVYHRTETEFDAFDAEYLGQNTLGNAASSALAATAMCGFWLNDGTIKDCPTAPGDIILEVAINLCNPLYFDCVDDLAIELKQTVDEWPDPDDYYEHITIKAAEWVTTQRDKGYDGIIIEQDEEFGGTSYCVFNAAQTKIIK
jgi:hypothetical protein